MPLFLPLLGGCGGLLLAHGADLAADGAFLGFAADFQAIATFFAGKNSHGSSSHK
jgi:hypothetical protein